MLCQSRLDRELIAAVKKRDVATARTLLQRGANVNAQDLSLLDRIKSSFRKQEITSQTPLLIAVQGPPGEGAPPENVSLVQALLDRGAAINATSPYGMTALMSASAYGHQATVLRPVV